MPASTNHCSDLDEFRARLAMAEAALADAADALDEIIESGGSGASGTTCMFRLAGNIDQLRRGLANTIERARRLYETPATK